MQERNNSQVNVVDLFMYLLHHWYWFVLCVLICAGWAYYQYARMPLVYRSDATIIIKDPSNTRNSTSLESYSNMINSVSMSNEILQLKSKKLMADVVTALDADVDYTIHERLRDIELYDRTPVRLRFERNEETVPSFCGTVITTDSTSIRYTFTAPVSLSGGIKLGDTLEVGNTRVVFQPTAYYKSYGPETEISIRKRPLKQASAAFLSRLSVSQTQSDGTILQLSEQDYSLQRANDLLNMLVVKYNESAIQEKNRIAVNTAAFINERLLIIQEELGDVEADLARFKSSQRVMDVNETASRYLSENRAFNAEIVNVESRLALAEYTANYLVQSFDPVQLLPVNLGLENSDIEHTIQQYNNLVLRREKLLASSSEDSPAVLQVDQALKGMQEEILSLIRTVQSNLNLRKSELSARENESLRKFTTMPAKARELLSIERQQNIKETLYMFLLNKREENALTQAMVDNNARMIDSAEGSSVPIYPSRNKMLLLGLLVGLLVPAVILIARILIDTKVRSQQDIDESLSLPFLTEIPRIKTKHGRRKKKQETPVVEYTDPPAKTFKETMRMMCTNIDFMKPEGSGGTVLLITSFDSGVGKSFVTRNVAACLADAAKSVIIVDADLRKRSISSFFGLRHHTAGMSNFLSGRETSLDELIRKDILEGVDLLPAGHIPPNPTELLSRSRLGDLLTQLRGRYDYIILDGTPVNMVADSLAVGPHVDMTLFILKAGVTDRRQLPVATALLQEERLKNLCIVLNDVDPKNKYGYSYSYGYGYGYGYGHGYYGSIKEDN